MVILPGLETRIEDCEFYSVSRRANRPLFLTQYFRRLILIIDKFNQFEITFPKFD